MKNEIKFVHTNIVARDWKKLSQFYIDVFGCKPVNPERDLTGPWIDQMTKIADVRITGVHLRLPGYDNGPTLEIFEYNKMQDEDDTPLINRPGFGHIAFHVSNVKAMVERVIAGGGDKYGEIVEKEIKGIGTLTAIYVRDLEGNIISNSAIIL